MSFTTKGIEMLENDQCCRNNGEATVARAKQNEACCAGKVYKTEFEFCAKNSVLNPVVPDYMFQWDYEWPSERLLAKYGME